MERIPHRGLMVAVIALTMVAVAALPIVGIRGDRHGDAAARGRLVGTSTIFSDTFTGAASDAGTWAPYVESTTVDRRPVSYSPLADQLTGSGLRIVATEIGGRIVTGGLDTADSFEHTYGTYSIRFSASGNPGFFYSFDLYPTSGDRPYINLGTGSVGGSTMKAGAAWRDRAGSSELTSHETAIRRGYNTIGVEWTPGSITYTLDGRRFAEDTGAAVPTTPLSFAIEVQPDPAAMVSSLPEAAQISVSSVQAEASAPRVQTAVAANTVPLPGSLPGWREVAADSFRGTALDRDLWTVYSSGHPTDDPSDTWSANDVSVGDGQLTLSARQGPDGSWTSAGLTMGRHLSQTYGMYLVRLRIDPGQGISTDASIWPPQGSNPPGQDFAETNGSASRDWVYATFHHTDAFGAPVDAVNKLTIDATQWHTYGVEWEPGRLVYTVDGHVWATATGAGVPDSPMDLCLQIQAWTGQELPLGSWENPVNATTPSTVSMHVAWVAVYAPSHGTPAHHAPPV